MSHKVAAGAMQEHIYLYIYIIYIIYIIYTIVIATAIRLQVSLMRARLALDIEPFGNAVCPHASVLYRY